jgi:cytochrome b pre-mRNA-processing protein 3
MRGPRSLHEPAPEFNSNRTGVRQVSRKRRSVWSFLRARSASTPPEALYAAIVARARDPRFYLHYGVPDSLDGRFEMIALHCYLVLHRLRGEGPEAARMAQALVDGLFLDMDANLREMGAGDLGVGKRVKRMASGFYGRLAAYERSQAVGDMKEALRRNLFGTVSPGPAELQRMEEYLLAAGRALAAQPLGEILAGRVNFGEVEFPPR